LRRRRRLPLLAIAALFLVLPQQGNLAWAETAVAQASATSGGSDAPSDPGTNEFNDPLEGFNRKIFGFNLALDHAILRPTAKAYRQVVPKAGRRSVTNFLDNLDTPVILANDILQGEFSRGLITTARFGLNSTFGIAGFFDIARGEGLPRHDEDFGQTLGVWGFGPGPYLMIPLLGPSDPRDGFGLIVDNTFDPMTWVNNNDLRYAKLGLYAVKIVSQREATMDQFDEIERTSIDFYAQVRSIYFQTRANDIKNGRNDYSDLPDISNLNGE
jgi:phospholipid-binding lipoprotein MlaA